MKNLFDDLFEKLKKRDNVNTFKIIDEIFDFSTRYGKTLEKVEAFRCFMDFEKSSHNNAGPEPA
jgi:hypothetical protein